MRISIKVKFLLGYYGIQRVLFRFNLGTVMIRIDDSLDRHFKAYFYQIRAFDRFFNFIFKYLYFKINIIFDVSTNKGDDFKKNLKQLKQKTP